MEKGYIIVLGNEKGGSGKTTSAMHLIVSLLKLGFTVSSIDLDSRQQSLTRYVENRKQTIERKRLNIPISEHEVVKLSPFSTKEDTRKDEEKRFLEVLNKAYKNDFIIIDTPGSDNFLSRIAHSYADTVITPINDSFIDVDLIGRISVDNLDVVRLGIYSEMFWEQKLRRAARDKGEIAWVVMRNRLSTLDAKNKKNVEQAIEKLSHKLGFKMAKGFGDRVIFKELFLNGLTLLDLGSVDEVKMNMSHVAARQELRDFISSLKIKKIDSKIKEIANY